MPFYVLFSGGIFQRNNLLPAINADKYAWFTAVTLESLKVSSGVE